LSVALSVGLHLSSFAEPPSEAKVLIKSVGGEVICSEEGGPWRTLEAGARLDHGVTIRTGERGTADLILEDSGTVLRLTPGSVLRLVKLQKKQVGEEIATETSLQLVSGSVVGSQRKLHTPSQFDIATANGTATIVGTEYVVRADGAVSVLSGAVTVNYNTPANGGSIKVVVSEGYSFDPATGQVVPTTPEYLQNLQAHIDTVKNNAKTFRAGRGRVVVKPTEVLSPTTGSQASGS
jgi:hypothetical protein